MNTFSDQSRKSLRYRAGQPYSMLIGLGLLIFAICSCSAYDYRPATPVFTASPIKISPTSSLTPQPTGVPTITLIPTPVLTVTPSPTAIPDFPDSGLFSTLKSGQYLLYTSEQHPGVLYLDGPENLKFSLPPLSRWSSSDASPLLSPDLKKLALIGAQSNRNSLRVIDLEGGKDQLLMEGTYCYDAAWSPDGTRLVAACDASIYLISLTTGERTELPADCGGVCSNVKWSPDGKWISFQPIYTNPDKTGLFLLSTVCFAQSGSCSKDTPRKIYPLSYPVPYAWSPDGKYLAMSNMYSGPSAKESIVIDFLDVQTGQIQRNIEIPGFKKSEFLFLAWPPDGKWIVFGQDSGIYRMPVEGGVATLLVADLPFPNRFQWITIP
jgi:WD40 repeat protein